MRKTIIVILLLIPLISYSQNSNINEFGDLRFGLSKAKVADILKNKTNVSDLIQNSDEDSFLFNNIRFGGFDFDKCFLMFSNNMLYGAVYKKEYESAEFIASMFLNIRNILDKKYGTGTKRSDMFYFWKDSNENSIVLDINPVDNSLSVSYDCTMIRKKKHTDESTEF